MNIEEQIEKAYDFRGHVTVSLKDGKTVTGFLFNRITGKDAYVELYPKDQPGSLKFAVAEIAKIDCTGEDCAAGDSYQDYLKRKAEREKGEFTGAQ